MDSFWHFLYYIWPFSKKERKLLLSSPSNDEPEIQVKSCIGYSGNMFTSLLLEEAQTRLKTEQDFLRSDKFKGAVRKAIKKALREPNQFIGYMDVEIDKEAMPIFCELMVKLCEDNNVKAKSIDSKYLEINSDSLKKLLKEIQEAERNRCIDDTLKGMFQTGIYR